MFTSFAPRVLPVALPSKIIQPVKRKPEIISHMLSLSFPLARMHPHAPQDSLQSSVKHLMIQFLSFVRWAKSWKGANGIIEWFGSEGP